MNESHEQPGGTPRKRSRWMLALPYVGVVFLLVAAEFVLRWVAPEPENSLFLEVRHDNIDWYKLNRSYLETYFAAGTPLIPEFKGGLIRKEKLPSTFRVFCLGGSSMFGTPYQMNANIPGILRRQLRYLYPERDIEVLNAGASAINSNVVLHLSKDLAEYKPDLVCIYMGHNEFYGPDGISASFPERMFPFLIQLKYDVRTLHLTRKLSALFSGDEKKDDARNLMQQVSRGAEVPLESSDAQSVISRFEGNLLAIIEFWQKAGVPVIVSDVSSNLMFPPFVSQPVEPALKQQITTALFREDFTTALQLVEGSGAETENSGLQYLKGEALLGLGRFDEARSAFVKARDLDLLKFRAPSQINEVIRNVSGETGVQCVPADSLLSAASENGIPGPRMFWEHLHPTVEGYFVIATRFAEAVRNSSMKDDAGIVKSGMLPFQRDTLRICWLDEAYADFSIARLTSQWPFSDYSRTPVALPGSPEAALNIARAAYTRQLVWDEACYKSAEFFWRTGDIRKALTTYEAVLEEYPTNFYAHYMLGNLLSTMGESEAALHHFNRSVVANPDYPFPRLDAGLLLINNGSFDAALKVLIDALPLTTEEQYTALRANIYYAIGAAYANKGAIPSALQNLDEALKLRADYPDAIRLKQAILGQAR